MSDICFDVLGYSPVLRRLPALGTAECPFFVVSDRGQRCDLLCAEPLSGGQQLALDFQRNWLLTPVTSSVLEITFV